MAGRLAASASGLFRFYESDPSNWEVLVKMVDGCRTNEAFWVLVSAATGFGWELVVTDELAGVTKTFTHPLDGHASGVADFVGGFVVTTGHGLDAVVASFEAAHDDYSAILAKALADRLAEAFAERLHELVRLQSLATPDGIAVRHHHEHYGILMADLMRLINDATVAQNG